MTCRSLRPPFPRQTGLSLVELMIALLLSSLLTLAVAQLYLGNRQTWLVNEATSRLQESARILRTLLDRELRMVDYRGCLGNHKTPPENSLQAATDILNDVTVALRGWDNVSGTPSELSGTLTPGPVANTDVLLIRTVLGQPLRLTAQTTRDAVITEDPGPTLNSACPDGSASRSGLCVNDIVLVSDCEKARYFQITALTPQAGNASATPPVPATLKLAHQAGSQPGNAVTDWGGDAATRFDAGAELVPTGTLVYYLASGNGLTGLYRKANHRAPELLIPNVDDFQVTYGVDSDSNGQTDSYVPASGSINWEQVRSIRIQVLLRSDRDVLPTPQPYRFNGTDFIPEDKALRLPVTWTIQLRNRSGS